MIPKCLNACIIASSFSGVHCGCLAFSDLAGLKFSPTSNPHFFLICAIYSDETLSPVCSSTYAFIYSYVAFPLNSDKSISSREKSTFTFLLSTIPLESKTTVSQNIFYRKAFKNGIDFTKRQFSKNLSVKMITYFLEKNNEFTMCS